MTLILTNALLIDCVDPKPIRGASVIVEDGRIVEVLDGHGSPTVQGARVIDLQGMYLLPGLWDVHVHLEWPRLTNPTLAEQAVQYGFNARQGLLQAGVVGIRTAGVPHFIDVGMKRAFDAWQPAGPRVFAGGYFLTTTAGHALASEFAKPCDGPNGFVKAIREQIQHGVDHIKLNLTGGIMGPSWDRHWHSLMLPEELEAALRIARQRGVPVAVHATYHEAVKWAVRAGAHSIEHGYLLDEEAVSLMAQGGVFYVPTLALSHLTADQASTPYEQHYCQEHVLPDGYRQRANRFAPGHEDSFRMALQAGVKIASGSDQGPPRQAALLEIEFLARYGLGAHGAIVAATRTAAELCRVEDRLGTIEPGKLADLIVVAGDPLEDIHNLRQLLMVIKAGEVVVGEENHHGRDHR